MFWFIFQEVGFYIFVLLTLLFIVKKQYVNLLVLHFWALAFATCFKFAITIWSPDKIVDMGIIFCLFIQRNRRKNRAVKYLRMLLIVLIGLLVIGNINALVSVPKYDLALNPKVRLLLQDFAYLVALALLLAGRILPMGFIKEFYKKYCTAIEIGAIIPGLIHFFCNRLGIPFMPIMRTGGAYDLANTVRIQFGNSLVSRVYGFAGEPKGLAFLLVPYLAIVLVCFLRGGSHRKNWVTLLFLILGIFVLFNTYSSSALITFILLLPFIFYYSSNRRSTFAVGALLVSVFIMAGVLIRDVATGQYRVTQFVENVYGRTFDRGMSEMEEGRQEAVILDAYRESGPKVWIFGWGLAQYSFNVPNMVNEDNQLIPVQSGIIITLSDFGVLGILVLIYVAVLIMGLLKKARALKNPLPLAMAMAALAKFIESLSHGSLITSLLFLMIATYSYFDCLSPKTPATKAIETIRKYRKQ